jgi:hypothetical protein
MDLVTRPLPGENGLPLVSLQTFAKFAMESMALEDDTRLMTLG